MQKALLKNLWKFVSANQYKFSMSRTILDPQYANDLNGLFNGSGTIDTGTITASEVIFSGQSNTPYLTSGGNTLVLSTPYQGGLYFSTPGATAGAPANTATFTLSADEVLASSASITTPSISATTYTGGLGCYFGSITIPGFSTTYTVSVTIPNFVGSANSVYVASLSNSSTTSILSTVGAAFSSVSGTGTVVAITITCTTGGVAAGGTADVSIIAMNQWP